MQSVSKNNTSLYEESIFSVSDKTYREDDPTLTECNRILDFTHITDQTLNLLQYQAALKLRGQITQLTIDALLQDGSIGWKNLIYWIQQIEKNTENDFIRMNLIRLTVSEDLMMLIDIDVENKNWKHSVTWDTIKMKLFQLVPENNIDEVTIDILKTKMSQEDNIWVYTSQVRKKYRGACELFGVNTLPISLGQTIASAVTGNMTLDGQMIYYDRLLTDPKDTIDKMGKSFHRNKAFKHSLFRSTGISSEKPNTQQSRTIQGNVYNSHHSKSEKIRKYTNRSPKNNKQFQRNSCWFYRQGYCRYGGKCWYSHIDIETVEDDRIRHRQENIHNNPLPEQVKENPPHINQFPEESSNSTKSDCNPTETPLGSTLNPLVATLRKEDILNEEQTYFNSVQFMDMSNID